MRGRIAGLGDDAPSAGAKRAKGAEGDRLVVQVEVLGRDDGVVVLVLAADVLVGGETSIPVRYSVCKGIAVMVRMTLVLTGMRASHG